MNGQKSSLKLQLRNSSTLHKGCITGNVLGITELGYCLQVDHQPSKKGIMFNVLMPEGNNCVFYGDFSFLHYLVNLLSELNYSVAYY